MEENGTRNRDWTVSNLKFMKTPYTNTTKISNLRIWTKGERNTFIFREEDRSSLTNSCFATISGMKYTRP